MYIKTLKNVVVMGRLYSFTFSFAFDKTCKHIEQLNDCQISRTVVHGGMVLIIMFCLSVTGLSISNCNT